MHDGDFDQLQHAVTNDKHFAPAISREQCLVEYHDIVHGGTQDLAAQESTIPKRLTIFC